MSNVKNTEFKPIRLTTTELLRRAKIDQTSGTAEEDKLYVGAVYHTYGDKVDVGSSYSEKIGLDTIYQGIYIYLTDGTLECHGTVEEGGSVATYTITVAVASGQSSYGTVNGTTTTIEGASVFIEAVPNTGYKFVQWNDGDTNAERTITMPSSNITYTATFKETIHKLTVSIKSGQESYGVVSGSGEYEEETQVEISAQANEGYDFVQWNDGSILPYRTITMPSTSITYTAEFEESEEFYIRNAYNGENTLTVTVTSGSNVSELQYKLNDGDWTTLISSSSATTKTIKMSAIGDRVYLRGDNPSGINTSWTGGKVKFSASQAHGLGGYLMSLITREDFKTETKIPVSSVFCQMFQDDATLISAANVSFTATTLTDDCYNAMFKNCSALTMPPMLRGLTLGGWCYEEMFENCTSLERAPELPATSLTEGCYEEMFYGCTSLKKAPHLPATTFNNWCYLNMFNGCTSLNEVWTSIDNWSSSYTTPTDYWLNDVSSTGTFHKKSTTTISTGTGGIPSGWTVVNDQ